MLKLCIISGQVAAVFFYHKSAGLKFDKSIHALAIIIWILLGFRLIQRRTYDLCRRLYRNYNFKHVVASRFVDVHKGWQTNENAHCISIVLVLIVRTMEIIEHAHYDRWIFTQICWSSFRALGIKMTAQLLINLVLLNCAFPSFFRMKWFYILASRKGKRNRFHFTKREREGEHDTQ